MISDRISAMSNRVMPVIISDFGSRFWSSPVVANGVYVCGPNWYYNLPPRVTPKCYEFGKMHLPLPTLL